MNTVRGQRHCNAAWAKAFVREQILVILSIDMMHRISFHFAYAFIHVYIFIRIYFTLRYNDNLNLVQVDGVVSNHHVHLVSFPC